jgi:hypothetical protein
VDLADKEDIMEQQQCQKCYERELETPQQELNSSLSDLLDTLQPYLKYASEAYLGPVRLVIDSRGGAWFVSGYDESKPVLTIEEVVAMSGD